jgi:starch synthase
VLPFHQSIERSVLDLQEAVTIEVDSIYGNQAATIFQTEIKGTPIFLVDGEPIRTTEGIYSAPHLDAGKFTFFSLASLQAVRALGWQPDLIHAHDWHTSTAVVWLARHREEDPFFTDTASLLTIHNLPYMGMGSEQALYEYSLSPVVTPRLPQWARHQPLPMGLASADWINAVSPTYAQEIQTPEHGCGLEDFLKSRKDRLFGILNGIDQDRWDPTSDPALPASFSADQLTPRRTAKRELQKGFGFDSDPKLPLIGMVTRLVAQKGVDIALEAMRQVLEQPWQFVLLGTGDPRLENMASDFARKVPDRVQVAFRFDDQLARRIYGGADMMLIPSRYEPCGLTQMIAMRYGCVPVVSATGGLKDTVRDYFRQEDGTGFVSTAVSVHSFADTLSAALNIYRDQRRWKGLQRRGMKTDFSWGRSAEGYYEAYGRAIRERVGDDQS